MKSNRVIIGLSVFILLLLGGGVYLGMSQFMQNEYQIGVKASNGIGLVCAIIYYIILVLTLVFSKVIPKLYEKHGALDDDRNEDK